jgi:sulfotransferase
MKHEFFFYSGLPRTGSTLLGALLNQHPEIYCSAISPVLECMYYTEQYFLNGSEQYNAFKRPEAVQRVIENVSISYYADIEKKYIIDKNRAWPNNIDRIKKYITKTPKIICIVRDVPSILASFINLIEKNKNSGVNFIDKWLLENNHELTTENRCMYLMQPIGIVNQSLWAFLQAFEKNEQHYLHIVEYEDLMREPDKVLKGIINYLNIESFNFDFDHIVNPVQEDDTTYNLEGMHMVRSKLEHQKLSTKDIIGQKLIDKYSGLEFWREKRKQTKIFGI